MLGLGGGYAGVQCGLWWVDLVVGWVAGTMAGSVGDWVADTMVGWVGGWVADKMVGWVGGWVADTMVGWDHHSEVQ